MEEENYKRLCELQSKTIEMMDEQIKRLEHENEKLLRIIENLSKL